MRPKSELTDAARYDTSSGSFCCYSLYISAALLKQLLVPFVTMHTHPEAELDTDISNESSSLPQSKIAAAHQENVLEKCIDCSQHGLLE
jgi:hypothetical protein